MAASRYLQFKIVQEPWSVYDLDDGSQIRVRCCLELAYAHKGRGWLRPVYDQAVWCNESLCKVQRKRKHYTMAERLQNIEEERCHYEEGKDNKPSKYRFVGGEGHISLSPNIRNISRTKLHDDYGDRIYVITFGEPAIYA